MTETASRPECAHGFLTSGAVAKKLGLAYHVLAYAVQAGHIPRPHMLGNGDLLWSPEDVENLRKYVLRKMRKSSAQCRASQRKLEALTEKAERLRAIRKKLEEA